MVVNHDKDKKLLTWWFWVSMHHEGKKGHVVVSNNRDGYKGKNSVVRKGWAFLTNCLK